MPGSEQVVAACERKYKQEIQAQESEHKLEDLRKRLQGLVGEYFVGVFDRQTNQLLDSERLRQTTHPNLRCNREKRRAARSPKRSAQGAAS